MLQAVEQNVTGIAQDRTSEHIEFVKEAAANIERALENIKSMEKKVEEKTKELKIEVDKKIKEAQISLQSKIEYAKDEIKEVSHKMHIDNLKMQSEVDERVTMINARVKEFEQVATDVKVRFETDCVSFF